MILGTTEYEVFDSLLYGYQINRMGKPMSETPTWMDCWGLEVNKVVRNQFIIYPLLLFRGGKLLLSQRLR